MTRDEHRQAAAWWLQQPLHLQAVGFSERVSRDALARFEAAVRADGPSDYRVFDRRDAAPAAADTADEVVAVRFIEPQQRNAAALGVNALSIDAAAVAIRRAQRSGEPSASAGFRLTQEPGEQMGVVIYRALYRGQAATDEAQRMVAFRGVAFVTLRMDDALNALMQRHQGQLDWCLVEREAPAALRRLAGPAGCEARPRLAYSLDRAAALCRTRLAVAPGCRAAAARRSAARQCLAVLGARPDGRVAAGCAAADRHRPRAACRAGGGRAHARAAPRGRRAPAHRRRAARQRAAVAGDPGHGPGGHRQGRHGRAHPQGQPGLLPAAGLHRGRAAGPHRRPGHAPGRPPGGRQAGGRDEARRQRGVPAREALPDARTARWCRGN